MIAKWPETIAAFQRNFPFRGFSAPSRQREQFSHARILIRMYYLFLLFTSIGMLPRYNSSLAAEVSVDPFWPIWWVGWVPFPIAFGAIRISFIATSLFATLSPERRLARLSVSVALLEFVALYTSVLRLDVDWYVWILTAFLLVFLPDGWREPDPFPAAGRERFLLVFWGCQAVTLLTYSLSGLGKILGAAWQIGTDQAHAFSPDAAARHIADRLLNTEEVSILGSWVITHGWIAWPFFLGSLYLLTFSLSTAFRPALHRWWGIGLILFHIANYLTINIGFSAHIFLNTLLLVYSPFHPKKGRVWETLEALPFFGILAQRISRIRTPA